VSIPTPPEVKPLAPGADLIAHTQLNGRPVSQLTFLEKSLLFAELARASYFCRTIAGQLAEDIGFPETRFYDREGAQAYLFGNETDAVICCRGTEPHEWNDIRADLNAFMDAAETVGRVHRGFRSEVNELWPRLEQALVSNERVLWFAGHSLGGAMTAICAGRCYLSHIKSSPEAVFTYGSPRVGDGRYINHIKLNYYRWVNNNDIVTRVPPRWMGYRHGGIEVYANRRGRVSGVTGLLRVRDRWWGFWRTILKGRVDHFADHLMGEYLWVIDRALDQERAGLHAPALERLLKKIGCPSVVPQPVVSQPVVPQLAPEAPHFVVMREGETDDVAEVVDVSEAG
jgi:triacylglycerol lipase